MKNVLIIADDLFEDSELMVPYYRMLREGHMVTLAAPGSGPIKGKEGYEAVPDMTLDDVDASAFDGLILPGGKAPASLRHLPRVTGLVMDFMGAGKPVAAICHGPQILVTAGVLGGRKATCYKSVAVELKEAGALYEDSEVVVDSNVVTSRTPADLSAFLREFLRLLG